MMDRTFRDKKSGENFVCVWESDAITLRNLLNELNDENEQLKSDNNRLVNETAKVVAEHQRKVFEIIDKKINLLENDYEKAVKSGMPSNSIYCEIELLEELKKELQE